MKITLSIQVSSIKWNLSYYSGVCEIYQMHITIWLSKMSFYTIISWMFFGFTYRCTVHFPIYSWKMYAHLKSCAINNRRRMIASVVKITNWINALKLENQFWCAQHNFNIRHNCMILIQKYLKNSDPRIHIPLRALSNDSFRHIVKLADTYCSSSLLLVVCICIVYSRHYRDG